MKIGTATKCCSTRWTGNNRTTQVIHVSERVPSLPFRIAGSKALASVEGFLFVEPAIRIFEGRGIYPCRSRDLFDYVNPQLAPEAQNDWFDYILEFERRFENAPRITVRERIGNSPVEPIENIPLYALEETVNNL